MQELGRLVLVLGLILVIAGGLLYLAGKLGLGGLPGDFIVHKGSLRIYFPLATCVLLSLLVTLLLWLFRR